MLIVLRTIGIFNAAIWLGSAFFFTFGVGPGIFSPAMKSTFPAEYLGIIAQNLIGRYAAVNMVCCLVAFVHFLGEMVYAGKPFRRFTFALLIGILALGLLDKYVFAPKIKDLHQLKYRGPAAQQPAATQQLSRLHATSMIGNFVSLLALVVYTWQVTNPSDPTRFLSAPKFRG